ncbi:uncharacterized protein LOC144755679 [Lissotriton helveticus]
MLQRQAASASPGSVSSCYGQRGFSVSSLQVCPFLLHPDVSYCFCMLPFGLLVLEVLVSALVVLVVISRYHHPHPCSGFSVLSWVTSVWVTSLFQCTAVNHSRCGYRGGGR